MKEVLRTSFKNRAGQTVDCTYFDCNDLSELKKEIKVVHVFCFYCDKMVIVYNPRKGVWSPPGGNVEAGETVIQAVGREVKEETNMKVLEQKIIAVQDVYEPTGVKSKAQFFCLVKPYGPFVSDPDEGITKVELIDPKDYKKYFDWGDGGEYVIKKALILLNRAR